MVEPKPARGRPQSVSTAELRRRAIAVVSARGYSHVTMSSVATEIGVSLRTLHRHFPSKSQLVWGALDDSFIRLHEQLSTTSRSVSVATAIQSAIVATFSTVTLDDDSGRERLRLIATTPELQSSQSDALAQWRQELTEFAAERLGLPRDDLIPVAIGSAAQAATLAALTWWATHDEVESAASAVGRALRALESDRL